MITGYNTDVEHGGVIYHVQTEDKGLETPLILSLVYAGGAILASKRSPYHDLIAEGFSDEALAERLKRQHRLICAAIHSGRIDDLKRMASRGPEFAIEAPPEPPGTVPAPAEPPHLDMIEATSGEIFELTPVEMAEPVRAEIIETARTDSTKSEQPFDIIELEEIPADAIQSVPVPETTSEYTESTPEYTFEFDYQPQTEPVYNTPVEVDDEETLISPVPPQPYIASEVPGEEPIQPLAQAGDGLFLTILDDDEFFSGEQRILRVFVGYRSGDYDKPLANVPLSVKILGTTFRPLIFTLKTERDGVATLSAQIPQFTSGRAAVLIKASTKGEAAELRRVIHPAR